MDSKENKNILTDEELDNAAGGFFGDPPSKPKGMQDSEALNIAKNKNLNLSGGVAKNGGLSATSTGGSGLSANIHKL
ncbi:hypothetical protein [Butyrivibrio sp. JL13D10]|uniref:hypothetical protein n=1 Tax=Butyrivibrio sp. JL13D10 TaxID=3236815 RepID=UPI0038B628B2